MKAARKAGWRVREGSRHVLVYPPDGSRPIPVSFGNGRRGANKAAQLRRHGLEVA